MWVPSLGYGMSVCVCVDAYWNCWWCRPGTLQPPRQWRPLLGTLLFVSACGRPVRALTVQLCSMGAWVAGAPAGRRMAGGEAEPGPLGPSRRRWLGSSCFPGSGILQTPLGRSGLPPNPTSTPTPAPGMFRSTPALLPKGRPPGAATAPPPLPGSPGGGRAGRTPGFLPPPIPERNSSEVPSGSGFPK